MTLQFLPMLERSVFKLQCATCPAERYIDVATPTAENAMERFGDFVLQAKAAGWAIDKGMCPECAR